MQKRTVVLGIIVLILLSIAVSAFFGTSKGTTKHGKDKIAVIHVDGVIVGGQGSGNLLNEQGGTDYLIKQLHEAKNDKSIKAIVLRVNSPGGSAPASQEVGEELKKIRNEGKIIVTSMGDMAASGGYWIAACTDKIYANPATMTGSIGVYIPYANLEELYKKLGISTTKIKSGPHKDILSPERQMSLEERALLQAMVDDIYNQFVTVVSEGRNMPPERVRQLADGRIYTGNQAKEVGLVDEIGNMYDAIEGAKNLAGIQGNPEIKEFGKVSPLSALFDSRASGMLERVFSEQLKINNPLIAPLALPVEWGHQQ